MRVLIETDWKDFIKGLKDEEKLKIFECLLNYPDMDCKIGAWVFMKKQIERDQISYQNRCKGLSVNRKNRWPGQSEQIENKVCELAPSLSDAIAKSDNNTNFNNKTNCKNEISAMIAGVASSLNINAETKYEIYHDFSFAELIRRDHVLGQILSNYPEQVLIKTQQALVRKCLGKKMTLQAITTWVEEQNKYYKGEKL